MKEFESLNNVQVKFFGYEKGQLYPHWVSNYESSFVMELLLLYKCDRYHYVLVTGLVKVVCYLRDIVFRFCYQLCRNCFWLCRDELECYNLHLQTCSLNEPAVIQMPSPDQSMYKFSKISAAWLVPLVIEFDFESFLRPFASCAGPSDTANTRAIEKHEPCVFELTVNVHQSTTPVFHHVDSSEDCMKTFVRILARVIHKQKNKHPFYRVNRNLLNKNQATQCWICENDFDVEDDPESTIYLDHCHFSGNFRVWAHEKCNRARRYVNFIPVVGHNNQNYDLHQIYLALNKCEPTTTVQVIPSTDE